MFPKEDEKKRWETWRPQEKKSPALTKIIREINPKHWRANHHYICLENRMSSIWCKVRAEGIFVNDSNFTSWVLGLEQLDEGKLRYTVDYLLNKDNL